MAHGLTARAVAMVIVALVVGYLGALVYADSAAYLFCAISGFVILPIAFRYSAQEFAQVSFVLFENPPPKLARYDARGMPVLKKENFL